MTLKLQLNCVYTLSHWALLKGYIGVYFILSIANVTEPIAMVLLNGQNENEGRVNILYGNIWGTICNHSFTMESGNVVCRQLGYRGALEVASFGAGTGQIWLDELQCVGNETSIEQCPHLGFGIHNCFHSDDVGVKCIG